MSTESIKELRECLKGVPLDLKYYVGKPNQPIDVYRFKEKLEELLNPVWMVIKIEDNHTSWNDDSPICANKAMLSKVEEMWILLRHISDRIFGQAKGAGTKITLEWEILKLTIHTVEDYLSDVIKP